MQPKIDNDLKLALKGGDKNTTEALRFLKSVLINAKIALGHELSDEEAIKVIRKEIKLRAEARDMYAAAKRQELADKEEFERQLYVSYVPQELNQAQILDIINKVAQNLSQPLTFAQIMPAVMNELAGRADGRVVSETVQEYLNSRS
jgi:uncharacterized protein YqeY